MGKESPLKLVGWADELGKGFSAHVETNRSVHTRLNDEYLGFELWTHEIPSEEGARMVAHGMCESCLGIQHEIKWR